MKIAITSGAGSVDGPVDTRFGRCQGFILYDTGSGLYETVDNTSNLNAAGGAGVQTARKVVNTGVSAVITGHCGPKAFRVLQAAGVKVFITGAGSVGEAIEKFVSGTLVPMTGPDVDGHWS